MFICFPRDTRPSPASLEKPPLTQPTAGLAASLKHEAHTIFPNASLAPSYFQEEESIYHF